MNEKQFEKMKRHLNGEMSPDETTLFEHSLVTDEELASDYAVFCALESKMPLYEETSLKEEALKKSIQQLNKVYFNGAHTEDAPQTSSDDHKAQTKLPALQSTNTNAFWKWTLVAASIAGIIIVSISIYIAQDKKKKLLYANKVEADSSAHHTSPLQPTPQKQTSDSAVKEMRAKALYKLNFKPDAVPSNIDGPLQEAFETYQHGDYSQAATFFDNQGIPDDTRGEQEDTLLLSFYATYYKGLSYMAVDQFSKALPNLQNAVHQSPGRALKAKAQWYLSLIYLNTGNIAMCEVLLKQVTSGSAPLFKAKAINLLNDLQAK